MVKEKETSNKGHRISKLDKISTYKIIAVLLIILLFSILFFSACSSLLPSPEQSNNEGAIAEESRTEDFPEEVSVDTISADEEPAVELDYQNLKTGAEMKGYIPSFLCTEKDNYIRIEITNTSEFAWKNERPGIVRIGYHYYGQDVDYVDYDKTSRSNLPDILEPGETVSVNVLINDIVNPGYYIIQIDPVIEGNEIPENNFWFSSKDVKMIEGLCYFDSCIK